ncbi:DUF3261 domain-containing protein [Aeromonas bivalvium]|uniref:DUF3261 domain-containing protein n=1 Tax=Aeromonas bivalvium TaxID=440079 RepID=UPI0038D13669
MRIAMLFGLLLLTACADQSGGGGPDNRALLTPTVSLVLPAPLRDRPLYRQQLLSARTRGGEHQLLTVLEADGRQLTLVGLTPSGIRLFRLSYDGEAIRSEQLSSQLGGTALPPVAQVLADVMLGYWPLSAWQPRLPRGWRLEDEGMVRRLRDPAGTLVSEIHYREIDGEREPVRLVQHAFDYALQMEKLAP